MHRFSQQSLSLLLLLTALATSNAFLAPGAPSPLSYFNSNAESSLDRRRRAVPSPPTTSLVRQSSSSGDDEEDGSKTINIAFVANAIAEDDDRREKLRAALDDHPFCKMTGVRLSVAGVPVASPPAGASAPWDERHLARLRRADIACFETASAVKFYLRKLDDGHLNVPEDISAEDRRKLPNRPDLVGDIVLGDGGSIGSSVDTAAAAPTFMAVCPHADTARECLNSGRWTSNHIYYPKDTQKAVELKTEPLLEQEDENEGSGDEVKEDDIVDIDIEAWAESVVQAAGDAMERKFWGGGW